jgi:hypothetical protein
VEPVKTEDIDMEIAANFKGFNESLALAEE